MTGDKKEGMEEAEIKQCSPAMVGRIMLNPSIKELLGTGFIFDGIFPTLPSPAHC